MCFLEFVVGLDEVLVFPGLGLGGGYRLLVRVGQVLERLNPVEERVGEPFVYLGCC